ncbi:RHS repeat-associated core domain-containing protein [Aquabacterium humicola]|uniref:RHS repeat-associated core domain-containing protein n=1 Tax=Aquabacterium humicola TaxID=3237377 RepID=UPI0025437AB5|nr:RHS repeat-associated core domain-containing protein [Rubrivivax pictus]
MITALIEAASLRLPRRNWLSFKLRGAGALAAIGLALLVGHAPTLAAEPELANQPQATLFAQLFPRPATMDGQSATLLPDGRWLLLGGAKSNGGPPSSIVSVLDPSTRRTTVISATLLQGRSHHSATLLPNGQVLILGGVTASGGAAAAELFDPFAGAFKPAGELGLLARSKHAATLLADGRLLVTGGLSSRGTPIAEAELFNTQSHSVERFNARLEAARFGHLAHLLPSHAVLLVGGYDAAGRPVPNAEIYDVARQRFVPVASESALEQARAVSTPAAPLILDSQPAADSRNVPVDQVIAVRLSKRMLVSTMNTSTVTLIGPSGAVPATVVPAESGMLLFVTPRVQLLPASTYTLFVKGATDERGQSVPFTTVGFTTASLAPGQATPREAATNKLGKTSDGGALQAANALARATPLPAPATATATARNAAPSGAAQQVEASEGEDWLITNPQVPGKWYYAKPFGGTMREYFKHIEDSRLAHHAQLLKAGAGVTAVAGSVKRVNGQPLAGVALAIGDSRTVSDAQGRFLLTGVPAGDQTLVIEGSTANRPNAFYGSYLRHVALKAGETLLLDEPIYLTKLDPKGTIQIPSPTTRETVVTTPSIPGLEIRIPAGTVIRDRLGNILTAINISPVPTDRAAFPMPKEADFPVYFTVQPSGAYIQSVASGAPQAVKVIYPNNTGQAPGTPVQFWAYDPVAAGWHAYGRGLVSADGKTIQPEANVGFFRFTGFSFGLFGGGGGGGGPCPGCAGGAGGGSPGGCGGGGAWGAGAGCGGCCGDPVFLARGTFLHSMTDLTVSDVVPLSLERTYMDQDGTNRAFGVGAMHRFDMNLYPLEAYAGGDLGHNAGKIALIQPNGIQLVFHRVLTSGTGNYNATWEHQEAGPFYKAVIEAAAPNFNLRTRDGTTYVFYGYGFNKLQAITDRLGNTIELARTPALSGPITKIISPHGRFIELFNDGSGRIQTAKDNIGRTVSYEYETAAPNAGRLKKVTLPDGGTWRYTYTPGGRIESVFDARDKRMVFNEYDTAGRVKKQTYADNSTLQIAYTTDGNNNVTQADVTDRRGFVRRVKFDANRQIIENVYPLGQPEQQTTTYVRDPVSGHVITSTDNLNRTTRYTYDALGNVKTITRLDGTPKAVTESFAYDPKFSRLKSRTNELLQTTNYEYDSRGNLIEIRDANSNKVTMTYDELGRLLTSKNALNHETRWEYAGPDLATLTDPLLNITQFGHDPAGRPVVQRDPLGSQAESKYDGMSRQTQSKNALGGAVDYEYDRMGNLRTHRDENTNPTVFEYGDMNLPTLRRDALLAADDRQYDFGNNLTRFTDRKGQVSGRRFDGLGRMTFVGYGATPAAPTAYTSGTRLTWDGGSRLTKLEDGACAGLDCATFTVTATIDRVYDDLDRLTRETSAQGQVDYTYYANGLRETMTVAGQPTVSYTYDPAGRLRQIQHAAGAVNGNVAQTITLDYDEADRRTKVTLANGITMTYGYDNASRLTSISYKRADQSVIGDLAYGYDKAGRRTSVSGSLANTELPSDVTTATHNANNQLTAWGGAGAPAISYDANGNLTHDGSHAYLWNSRNQLTEIRQGTVTGPLVASYGYDPAGRRISRTVGSTVTGFLHDGWNVVQELNAASANAGKTNYKANVLNGLALDERYLRAVAPNGSDSNLPRNPANPSTTAPLLTSLLTDALGSTLKVTKADQVVQASFGYEPFGRTTQTTPPGQPVSDIPYQYTGRENEAASATGNQAAAPLASLYYYRNRFYSVALQRFVSEDPIDLAGGSNFYTYVGANPVSLADPSGLMPHTGPMPNRQTLKQCPDPCVALDAAISETLSALKKAWVMLFYDPENLWDRARYSKIVGLERLGTYSGHRTNFYNMRNQLRNLIQLARENSCPVDPEAERWSLYAHPPISPQTSDPGWML